MAVSRRPAPPPPVEVDLEETAELPMLDGAYAPEARERHEHVDDPMSRTDTWHGPALNPALSAGVGELAATLHDVEERLKRKAERVTTLEREMEQIAAELNEARDSAQRSGAELGQLTTQFTDQLAQINTQHAEQVARVNARFTAQVEQLEESLRGQTSLLEADRRALAEREAQLAERTAALAQRDQALQERDRQYADAQRLGAEQATRLHDLEQQRSSLATKIGYLDEKLGQRTNELETHRDSLQEALQRLERADLMHASLARDLNDVGSRNERQLEALRTAQMQRAVFESMVDEREQEISLREQRIAQLTAELAQIAERDERIRALEDGSARAAESISSQQQQIEELRAALAERTARVTELDAALATASRYAEEQASGLARTNERYTALETQVVAARDREASLNTELNALRTQLTSAARNAEDQADTLRLAHDRQNTLEAQVIAARERESSLTAELGGLRAQLEERVRALSESSTEAERLRAELSVIAQRQSEADTRHADQQDIIRSLQQDLQQSGERSQQLEQDLHAAEDLLNRLESDVRQKDNRVDELVRGTDALQTKLAATQRSLGERDEQLRRMEAESQANAVVLGNIQQSIKRLGREEGAAITGTEAALEGMARLFTRTDNDSEVVHVLGRKTKIGRTPDNDIQIDTNYISRHHAAVLASSKQTIVEDLNSTNGVFVNGRRVNRQVLNDGDIVTIGKTAFKFTLKPLSQALAAD